MSFDNLFKRVPELKSIMQAIEEYFSGQPVTSRCIHCDELLVVDYVELTETGTTTAWVNCSNGCTAYHSLGELNNN